MTKPVIKTGSKRSERSETLNGKIFFAMKAYFFVAFIFCKFLLVNSASKPSSYDPIVITRNLAEALDIPLTDSEEIIKMTKEMRTKTSKELYDWLNKKIGDAVSSFTRNAT